MANDSQNKAIHAAAGIKHSDSVKATGTSYTGKLDASYARLVHHFGTPNRDGSADGKVKAEWKMNTPHGVATIYDYKSDMKPEHNTDWHVGSKTPHMHEFLDTHMKMRDATETARGKGESTRRSTGDGFMGRRH